MKPTPNQKQYLKDYLYETVEYREVYEEVYDHILTALESVPDGALFIDAAYDIMENDLGGKAGIIKMQAKYKKIAIREFIGDYFDCLTSCITSYLILLTVAATAAYYLLMKQEWFMHNGICRDSPFFIIYIPAVIISAKHLIAKKKAGYRTSKINYAKSCIKSFINTHMLFFPSFLWPLTSFACIPLQSAGIITEGTGYYELPNNIGTVLFFITMLHALAYYKLYSNLAKASL
jgi:hypothetical protein